MRKAGIGSALLVLALGLVSAPAAGAGERPAAVKIGGTLAVTGPF